MIVYSHTSTPRLQYVVNFLSRHFDTPIKIVCDEDRYLAEEDRCKINYSYHRIDPAEIWIHCGSLLFETTIRPVTLTLKEQNGYPSFFETEGDAGFDLFAAIFYLLSRYEEYLPHQKDIYGRYDHQNAIAFRENFLQLPLVNIWLEDFRKLLTTKYSSFTTHRSPFTFQPTYDIDMAWSYREKGFKRFAGAFAKDLFSGKFKNLKNRTQALNQKTRDPFDCYDWLDVLHNKFGLAPIYFFLVAEEKGKYDKNISPNNPEMQELIKRIAKQYKIGLHPSWKSGDNNFLLGKEKNILETLSIQTINASRQHYIRFHLPHSFQKLIQLNIKNDYSMGYGTINGFRASVATPFFWYDLQLEKETDLLLHPFCFMDANAYYEQKQSPETTLKEMLEYYKVVKAVNGTMITIWHNSFLGNDPEFEGWSEAYKEFIQMISKDLLRS